ncbi:HdeD family acid-resistance protein [Bifidobacterium sp. ESL0728]|uniref:HdeD family acid-resistance protein n=1 Tax=Bifidobacterium sp. ESL0728 TaxID=2983220 RepID=UPI0023F6FCB8|nr:HdeD family acid-resistance protein [Bifidobacterium sp. ESL0728]WEV59577.1 HdeD family acid-resistance protein [Bifidobacterium sp. ESL0728]
MSDANTNDNNLNVNGNNENAQQQPNSQQPSGQPEYGAYAPNANAMNGNENQSENNGYAQNAGQSNQNYGQYTGNQGGAPQAGPNANPYVYNGQGQNQNQAPYSGYGPNGYGPYAADPNQYDRQYQNGNPYANANQYANASQNGQYQYARNGQQTRNGGPTAGNNNYFNAQSARPGSNEWWRMNPFKLAEEWLPNQAKKTIRIVYGVVGVVALLLGLALLIWPGKTLVAVAIVLGAYFVVSGAIRIIGAIVENGLPGGWRVLDILVGLLLVIGGVIMLKNTAISTALLTILVTLTVGIGWIMEGIMALVETWRLPKSGWAIFYAIISILAGIVVLFSPFASVIVLVVFAGIAMVVMGILAIVRAFRFGKK